jgi:hypothetical protein
MNWWVDPTALAAGALVALIVGVFAWGAHKVQRRINRALLARYEARQEEMRFHKPLDFKSTK